MIPSACLSSLCFHSVRASFCWMCSLSLQPSFPRPTRVAIPCNPTAPPYAQHTDSSQPKMHPENVWRWLDAIDQDHLDPLDQWGLLPSPRRSQDKPPRSKNVFDGSGGEIHQQNKGKHNAELASLQAYTPPAGILLRNGSIRPTGQSQGALDSDA